MTSRFTEGGDKLAHIKELSPDIQRVANEIAERHGHPKPYPQTVVGRIMKEIKQAFDGNGK